ncbi:helix-turn-helix transcriptional regulator [Aeromonas veronii]|uniref:helix-turn-helix transcriptional regulator n=2 Tax=Aeromonadaceae TaxID=84642 RepID=UPI0029D4F99A|nr:AlpA family phage regulatory protein [Aeromonas veronii]MDX7746020.1 AlpA family phage regulatory protein [Aeromonas veronii]
MAQSFEIGPFHFQTRPLCRVFSLEELKPRTHPLIPDSCFIPIKPGHCAGFFHFRRTHMAIPETGFIREAQLVTTASKVGPLPFSKSTLWRMVGDGKFPKPIKLGPRVTAWRCEEVHAWISSQGKAA